MHCLQYHVISSGDVVCLLFGKPCLLYCCSLYICCSVIVNCVKQNNCWSLQFSQLTISSRLRQSLLWTLIKPSCFDLDPNSPTAAKQWKQWHSTFTNFIGECADRAPNKFRILINYLLHKYFRRYQGLP